MKSNEWHDTRTSFFEWHDTNDQKVKKKHHLILKKPTKNILQKKNAILSVPARVIWK